MSAKCITKKSIDEYKLSELFSHADIMKGFEWLNIDNNYGNIEFYQLTTKDKILYVENLAKPFASLLTLDFIENFDYCCFYNLRGHSYINIKIVWTTDRWFKIKRYLTIDTPDNAKPQDKFNFEVPGKF